AIVSADSDGLQESHNSGTVAMSGTSMATPAVAGAAALVRQYFMEGFQQTGAASPAVAFTPSGALVKAALINSAQNMTGADTDGAIPSTGQGWGRINLANVLSFTGDARKMDIVDERNGLSTGELWSRVILVDGAQPFKVTVVWADYPGTIGASKALVNDLDLAVTCPDGATLTGNAFANGESTAGGLPDRLNVEEQVMIKHPLSGYYTISVHGYNIPNGPQPFAYVASAAFNATSRGTIRLDRRTYNSRGTLELSVADRDLNLDPGIAEQISILVSSTSEPAGERVILTESRADSAVFTGILALNGGLVMPADGLLQVAQGDSISATYLDANDGSGQSASVTAHAGVDNTAPVISGFAASDITETTARLSWTTDEPTSATIDYGETTDTRETVVKQTLAVDHQVRLSGLREATTYYAHLHGRDEANNETTSGDLTITTLSMPPSLTITSSDGESTIRDSVIVSGQSIDPSGVAAVTVNGVPVSYRPSDGYYEIRMTLQYGANNLTALAIDSLGNAATRTISVTRIKVPDLEVTAVSGPALAKSGQTLMVADSVTARSEGTNAPSFFLEVYLSADSSCGVGDISIGGRYVEPLNAGESRAGSTQVTVPANVASGNYYYCAIADPLGNVAEVNTTNNALAGSQVKVVGADLEVTAVSGPAVGRSGQALTIVDTVRARPEAGAAPSSYLQIFLSTDSQCSVFDISLGGHAVADLAAGESRTGSTQVTVPADLPTASYYYCAIADPVDVVPEENEANNTLAGNRLTVVGADLEVTAVSGPATAKSGQVLTIADTVRNRPEAGAAPSSYLQLFLSIDSQCSVFDISLGGHAVAALAAGESRTGSTQVTVPASLPPGSYYYCAIADPAGVVPEGNEANNALAGNRVTVVGADLEVTAVSGPATAKSGQPITIADTVRNRLEAGAAPSSYLQVFLSTDSQCSLFDTSLGGHAIAALAAGESRTGSTQVTIPVNLPPGSYYYCAIADPAGVVPEGNESNNTLVGNLVTLVGADLEVTAVSGPATAKSGQPITIADTVWARPEAGAAPASYLQVFLSTDSQCNVFDTSLGGHAVAVLAAGESRTGSTQVTVPVSPGSYYYCALVDPAGAVPEENETNNTLVGNQVTVVPREAVGTDLLFAGNFYQSFTSVYAGVGNGATATIKARAVVLAEDLQFGKNAIINLIGGYDPVFASVVGVTTLHGTVTIIDGTLIVENVAIE
ncbi:MAG TPA: CARDB domain-containing protein, partial [Geobacteraceae bacterium]